MRSADRERELAIAGDLRAAENYERLASISTEAENRAYYARCAKESRAHAEELRTDAAPTRRTRKAA